MSNKRTLLNKLDSFAVTMATGDKTLADAVDNRRSTKRVRGASTFGRISYPLRAGYATRSLPRGEKVALFVDAAAANRAIRRAERWIKQARSEDINKPPGHIIENATLADFQANS